jgi:putative transposase
MSNYRRNYVAGGTYFFTVVTQLRLPILGTDLGRACLREAFLKEQERRPFDLFAIVLLPDHLHTIWTLPPGDDNYSVRWSSIKEKFTKEYRRNGGSEGVVSHSRRKRRERGIWQRRFWEHTCRNDDDLKRYLDYLHWNPCKHGLVQNVRDYQWSTFDRFVRLGEYAEAWGSDDPCPDWNEPEWE